MGIIVFFLSWVAVVAPIPYTFKLTHDRDLFWYAGSGVIEMARHNAGIAFAACTGRYRAVPPGTGGTLLALSGTGRYRL
jgi:hypothetical protein